jgi:hypothetical protein
MQIRPVRRDLQTSGLGDDQSVFVGLSGGERASRVQLHQIIIEHTFNIRSWAASPRPIRRATGNGQHDVDPDNTQRRRRTKTGVKRDLRAASTAGRQYQTCATRSCKYFRSIGFVTSSRAR